MHKIADAIARIVEPDAALPLRAENAPVPELPLDLFCALQSWLNDHPEVEPGAEAIRFIIRDYLTAHGYLPHRENLEGAI